MSLKSSSVVFLAYSLEKGLMSSKMTRHGIPKKRRGAAWRAGNRCIIGS